jgi:hypothetical protein
MCACEHVRVRACVFARALACALLRVWVCVRASVRARGMGRGGMGQGRAGQGRAGRAGGRAGVNTHQMTRQPVTVDPNLERAIPRLYTRHTTMQGMQGMPPGSRTMHAVANAPTKQCPWL